MRFISWNVNGLRAVVKKGFEDIFYALDADHFCTENVIIPILCEKLRAQFPALTFAVSRVHAQTAQTYCP